MAVTKFRASQIANATTEDGLKSAQFNDGELTTVKLADGANFIQRGGSVAFTADQSMGSHKLTNLTDGSAAGDAVNKGQLDTKAAVAGSTSQAFSVADASADTQATSLGQVKTLLQNAGAASEWQNSCNSYGITPPGSPTTGDRVLIIESYAADTGVVTVGIPTGAFNGKGGQVAQWSGSAWVFTVLTNGTYVSVDTETAGFFFYSGTLSFKQFEATTIGTGLSKTANAISLAATVAGAGLTHSTGVLAVGAGNGITVNADDIALASTTAGNGLTYTTGVLAVGSGNGISVAADAISVNADGSTLDGTAASLKVKDAGITATQLASSVAGNGLTGGAGTALAVGAGTGISVAADSVALDTTVAQTFTNYKHNITPTGTPNNVLVTFTLPETPRANTLQLFVSGILMEAGAGNDFTISGATITMAVAPATTDKLRAFYWI